MTHAGHFETVLMEKLPVGSPKLVVERIYQKSAQGFENPIKTDVLAIRVSKSDASAADKAMQKLLPPQVVGEYYVCYTGLDDDVKWKVYKHQNWYLMQVKVIPVSGFGNIA